MSDITETRGLLMACSDRKVPRDECAAGEMYDGVMWRVWRNWCKGNPVDRPRLLILSAEYGLLGSQEIIRTYNRKMTPDRISEIMPTIDANMFRGLRELYICAGELYAAPILLALDPVRQDAFRGNVIWTQMPIGKMMHALKEWLG